MGISELRDEAGAGESGASAPKGLESFSRAEELIAAAREIVALAKKKGLSIVTAESCTAGLLTTVLSEAPDASELLHGGFVTYTKRNKTVALGVPEDVLESKGAVCREVACAMAEGALARSPADVSAAITGVAGPSADEDGNPIGLVCVAAARRGLPTTHARKNHGNIGRQRVRECAVADALEEVKRILQL
jgi:nicotinamide-nucleotide amidase